MYNIFIKLDSVTMSGSNNTEFNLIRRGTGP
jgi:hypothetical protein